MSSPDAIIYDDGRVTILPVDGFAKLREKFPPEVVGKLPKAGIKLDYVGHAAVTDRLLSVDPHWTWEPLSLDERGLPAYDNKGGLWIRLTVLGVTRLGYGDGPDPKQRIGDAIRNGAMRFGVALDLWSKEELESELQIGGGAQGTTAPAPAAAPTQAADRTAGAGEDDASAKRASSPPSPAPREPAEGQERATPAPVSGDRAIESMQRGHAKKLIGALRDDEARSWLTYKRAHDLSQNPDEWSDEQLAVAREFLAPGLEQAAAI